MNYQKTIAALFSAFLFCMLISVPKATAQQWDTLAPIPINFTFPVVVALDGKIHIMGGGSTGGATNKHYAYDPNENQWEEKALLPYVAQQPAGAVAGGKIHFFGGGFPHSGFPVDSHVAYDPTTDSWEEAAKLNPARAIHYGVGIGDDVYSLAGQGVTTRCERYDGQENQWEIKASLPDASFAYGAHVAAQGKIYRFCGGGYSVPNDNASVYDPATDTWSDLPTFPVKIHAASAAAIGDKIYIVGGYSDFVELPTVWEFDTQTEEYTLLEDIALPYGRNYHQVVSLDSCLYVVGGSHDIEPLNDVIRTQLLRICISETSAVESVTSVASTLDARLASGQLTVTIPEEVAAQKVGLTVYDMSGQAVFSKTIHPVSSTYQTYIGKLPTSMYIVQLSTENKLFSGKVLDQ